jgi:hypothetical protein
VGAVIAFAGAVIAAVTVGRSHHETVTTGAEAPAEAGA